MISDEELKAISEVDVNLILNYPALKDGDSCFTEDSFTHRSYD